MYHAVSGILYAQLSSFMDVLVVAIVSRLRADNIIHVCDNDLKTIGTYFIGIYPNDIGVICTLYFMYRITMTVFST